MQLRLELRLLGTRAFEVRFRLRERRLRRGALALELFHPGVQRFGLCVEAGLDPPAVARSIFDSNNLGRLKLFGAVLSRMELDASGRLATVWVDRALARNCGGTYEDTEGLINLPLTVKEIQAVVFFKEQGPEDWRISMRSKGEIDINSVAKEFGGGGHKNAAGCSATGTFDELTALFRKKITEQIDNATSLRT